METESMTFVMIPKEEWMSLVITQKDILQQLKDLSSKRSADFPTRHLTALEFMQAVRIKRTKFDQLVKGSKIRIIKKRRKIYVPVSEVERYFRDTRIQ